MTQPAVMSLSLPQPLEAVVCDFDGVFTYYRVLTFQDGTEAVSCSRSDGMGIELLRGKGLPMVMISKERNPTGFSPWGTTGR